jgi:hypothetical protein
MHVLAPNPRLRRARNIQGSTRALACGGRRPRRPHLGIFPFSYRIWGMPSARAPMATREGACAPRAEAALSLREDQGLAEEG